MEPILTIDNLNSFGGNMLRQGDKSQLKYRLRDVGNKNLGISSKPCQVKMYGRNYTTVVYETTTTVSSENTVSFTIDKVLPKGTFYLEFTVGDYIFPTDHREFFEITPSGKGMEANIIEIVGKDVLINAVKSQVDAELQPLVTSLESAEQAEIQRATAETTRVSAEAQRVTDHANRSAEFDGKADKVVLENLVENGDFSQGDLNWFGFGEIQGDLLISQNHRIYQSLTDKGIASDAIMFMSVFLQNDSNSPNDETLVSIGVTGNLSSVGVATKSKINSFSRRFVKGSNSVVNVTVGVNDRFNLDITKGVVLLNLTTTFGAGNEPTKEEMDELIKVTGYIDGEYALNNKEMLGHLMKGIGEKANKKQEDWITPTLLNGWAEVNSSTTPVRFMKDEFGFVHLKGQIQNGLHATNIFELPVGYRPSDLLLFPIYNANRIEINSKGGSTVMSPSGKISLSGIHFKAEV